MPIPRSRALTFKARGLSDTFDSTNTAPGMMASLSNLIPAPQTADAWVSRPASTLLTGFGSFASPAQGEALFSQGSRIYGMIQSARFSGKSEPFIYDTQAAAFITLAGVTSANCPTSTLNTGGWTPPTIDQVGAYVLVTHPGFNFSGGDAFGWFDMSGFTSNTITGNTHSNKTVDSLSANVLSLGWKPGMTISSSASDIPAGTTIVSIAADGMSLTLSANATGSNTSDTFTVAGGTFAAPRWAAGNLNTEPLVAIPVAVAQYAGSACFAVNTTTSAAVVFSDSGNPLVCTNAGQIATFQNGIAVTALKGLPLNTLTGGIVQSLIAFQGPNAIQQLTGSPTTMNLSVNSLNDSTGTVAGNSVASTPKGLLFAAPDGIRRISFFGVVSDAIGRRGNGVTTPFLFAANPSRMAAAYNESVYRVSVQNGSVQGTPTQEYWYHEDDDRWSGPHTFPAAVIVATQTPHSFALFAPGINGKLWNSDAYASLSAIYVENGAQMFFAWEPSLLPDTQQMSANAMIETLMAVAVPPQQELQFTAVDEQSNVIGTAVVDGSGMPPALWGEAIWGQANWGAGSAYYRQRHVIWPAPIVFKQMQVMVAGQCAENLQLGNLYMRYTELGYTLLTATG